MIESSSRFRLTPEQYQLLLQPLHRSRVGKNPKGFSHLEAWDIRRWLIRVFGFGGYRIENTVELVKEIESPPGSIKYRNGGSNDKTVWTVVYRAEVRLTVYDQHGGHAVFEDVACGDATNQPSVGDCHDNAIKTAVSQGLKRCAVNLGDQFGLGLYNGGGVDAVVVRTVVDPLLAEPADTATPMAVEDAPVRPEPGSAQEHYEPASAPPEAEPRPTPTAPGVRDWALHADRTAEGIRKAADRLRQEHPDIAAERVVNEHGDDELLSVLMDRRARDLDPQTPSDDADDRGSRRRKRMFALFRDLGYDGPANQQQRRTIAGRVTGRDVTSMSSVTAEETELIISALEGQKRQRRQPTGAA
ncbi:hypothetical protein HCB17_10655 [Salinispora arenicola]|uniref:Rad52/Rad22 family DNA repair protein n=1 Tax=Salinispora arenicola TaxID=168697 RepID=UPI0014311013|nr:Rad52/Rad22 family DNA repair protein [Salinispora arenicola]NIL41583.1 hypothetical protein [Salinispora arenicola]